MTNHEPKHPPADMAGLDGLIERLRSVDVSWSETGEWCAEAAARIEALEAALEQCERETVERIVAWLSEPEWPYRNDALIAAIEAGEHLK